MTARTFTMAVLLALVTGAGWIAGLGVRARSAVSEVPVAALADPGVAAVSGIRLGGPEAASGPSGGSGVPLLRIFGDYQCPACRALEREAGDSLRALAAAGLITLVYHHRPLSTHPRGSLAAEVAYCGAADGHGARVHDALLASADRWPGATDPLLVMLDAVGSSVPSLAVLVMCVSDSRMVNRVDGDRRLADSLAVTAVPAVFLDAARVEFRSYAALVGHVTRKAVVAARRRAVTAGS
jgi:protein-disulfide isomerase